MSDYLDRRWHRTEPHVFVTWLLFCGILLLSLSISVGKADAAGSTDSQFQVKAVVPSQQENKEANYFKFSLSQGQTTTLGLRVYNLSKKKQTFRVRPTVGVTNDTGTILYSDVSKTRDNSLKFDFTKMGPQARELTIPAGETGIYTTQFTIPNQAFTGVVVGGFYIDSPTINKAALKAAKKKKSIQIRNVYGYAIGAEVNIGNVDQINPDFKLTAVKPTVISQKGAAVGIVQNTQPQYVGEHRLSLKTSVYKRGSTKKLFSTNTTGMNFAPNSHVNVTVSWGNNRMEAGDYTMKVKATRGEKGDLDIKTWHLSRNFTITPEQAARANKNPNIKKNYMWLIILLIIVLVLLVALLLVYVYKKGKTSRHEPTKQKRHK